jgi:hypothetical protein
MQVLLPAHKACKTDVISVIVFGKLLNKRQNIGFEEKLKEVDDSR